MKASGSANKQKEFTYDLGDNELDAIITGRDGPRRANIYGD